MGIITLVSSSQLETFIQNYVQTLNDLTSKFSKDQKVLLLPEYLSKTYKIVGTISRSHGVAIEFTTPSKRTSIKIRYDHRPIERVVLPSISDSDKVFLAVKGSYMGMRNLNVITANFFKKYKDIIEGLSRGSNLLINFPIGTFIKVNRGDIRLIDVAFACLSEGKEIIRRPKFLWIFGGNSSKLFSPEIARQVATNDYKEVISGALARVPVHMLLGTLSAYQELLDKEEIPEEEIQQFLEKNRVLLSIDFSRVHPKYRLGEKFVVDFLVETSDLLYTLVEIEKPSDDLYTKERPPKQSKKLRQADAQMKEYLSYVHNNILYLRKDFPSLTSEKIRGLIVIGRRSRLSEEQKRRLEQDNAQAFEYKIITFDDLATRLKTFLENLGIRYSPFV